MLTASTGPVTRQQAAGELDGGVRPDSLTIDLHPVDEVEGCVALHLRGHLGSHNLESFRDRLDTVVGTPFPRLILHCAGLQELSGSAIGAFAALQRKLRLHGGDMVLLKLPPRAAEPFRLLGFSDLLPVTTGLDEAISYLFGTGQAESAGIFPHVLQCPACETKLRAARSGRFRCSNCQNILAINNGAQVFAA